LFLRFALRACAGATPLSHRYWEVVELIRKLALTSILALIAPGSAGQGACVSIHARGLLCRTSADACVHVGRPAAVVVGLLLAFIALLLNLHLKPYAENGLNLINNFAQLNLVRCAAAPRQRPCGCTWRQRRSTGAPTFSC
jgi:hypothetical protein